MKTVGIYRAQPIAGEPAERVTIEIDDEIPPITGSVEEAQRVFEEQSAQLASALWRSLPGGTIDALLRELLMRRATVLRVPFGSLE